MRAVYAAWREEMVAAPAGDWGEANRCVHVLCVRVCVCVPCSLPTCKPPPPLLMHARHNTRRSWIENLLTKRLDPLLGPQGERLTLETLRKASTVKVRAIRAAAARGL